MKTAPILILMIITFIGCRDLKKQQTASGADSTDSYILYIGTYTEKESHVEGKAKGIYVYRMNATTGRLTYISTSPFTMNPSFLDISRDGKFLYAVNETGGDTASGYVSAFRITNEYTKLEFINRVSSEGDYPCYVETEEKGHYVLTVNYGTGNVALLPVNPDGSLSSASFVHQHQGKGTTPRQESPHAHCIVISPDGRHAYSCDLGTDRIYIYEMTGNKPVPSGDYKAADGSGPRHLVFHPVKQILYSINELNGTVDCLQRDTISGNLTHVQTILANTGNSDADPGSADIHIAATGEFLYVSNRGNLNNIACFRADDETGELSLTGVHSVKGSTPRNFAIDPAGKFLLVANQNSGQIVTFMIDPLTGRLADTGIETMVPTPVCIKFLPVLIKQN